MGAKGPVTKGGGGSPPNSTVLHVAMTVANARVLLESLTSGTPPPQQVAKTIAVAVVRPRLRRR